LILGWVGREERCQCPAVEREMDGGLVKYQNAEEKMNVSTFY
jgi:hypothetical protein